MSGLVKSRSLLAYRNDSRENGKLADNFISFTSIVRNNAMTFTNPVGGTITLLAPKMFQRMVIDGLEEVSNIADQLSTESLEP